MSICLLVCLFGCSPLLYNSKTSPNFCACYTCDSVLLWRRCDMLSTSGFADDITFLNELFWLLLRLRYASVSIATGVMYVCLSVRIHVCCNSYVYSKLHQIFHVCCLCPWLGILLKTMSHVTYSMTSRFFHTIGDANRRYSQRKSPGTTSDTLAFLPPKDTNQS